jgi:aryl-alcohol dehydrogenase-like predicted oxidoreductase
MKQKKLGNQGLTVSALGLGCMGMSYAYGPADEQESLQVLDRARDLGINFFDTAEVYGPYKNEELIGRWLKNQARDKIILATKFGFTWGEDGRPNGVNSKPAHIKQSIEGSLKRLGTDYIDLYYQHRLDPETPIEDTMTALAELVHAGKIRYIGLSEVGIGTIRRAHAVHPVSAVQSEYSLWDRNVEEKILPLLQQLNIGFVPFSPIGRGFLTGKIENTHDLSQLDFRQLLPRFHDENIAHNLKLVELLKSIATANNVTPVQIALAWLLKQGDNIVPIPGTKHLKYLEENIKSASITLPESAWHTLDDFLATFEFHGVRYPDDLLKRIDRSE